MVAVWIEIDDDHDRALGPGRVHDAPDVMLGQDTDALRGRSAQQAEAGRAKAHLAGRLLARGVQDRAAPGRPGQPGRGLKQQRGLADARLTADEDQRARHEPAPKDPVELVDPQAQARQVRIGDGSQTCRRRTLTGGAERRVSAACRLVDDRLDQAVPLAAGWALTFPAQERLRAGLADEAALRPRHR